MPRKSDMQDKQYFAERIRIISQYFEKYEEREEQNQQVGLHEKWQALAKFSPVEEGTKWTHVCD